MSRAEWRMLVIGAMSISIPYGIIYLLNRSHESEITEVKPRPKMSVKEAPFAGDWHRPNSDIYLRLTADLTAELRGKNNLISSGPVSIDENRIKLSLPGARAQHFILTQGPIIDLLLPDPGKDPKLSSVWIRVDDDYLRSECQGFLNP